MSVACLTSRIESGAEPIPGYILQQRIGEGGYGEVWKAIAPGGLSKAIKFVFGKIDDKRAQSELNSLNRIKSLTHPFLLTLERIECVHGCLVIVTELADTSLAERYSACRRDGLAGIPREELLRYLTEAADALDFLSQRHSLQHLDIKPDNLLLVSDHVKIADFGLLKDLYDRSSSTVGGLTPRYAAPEVFDGKPSRHSDQYSLAVMYQELVTGCFPFREGTAATLASQHLHAQPDMAALSPLEQSAVGKALSKDPASRFESCGEFVARLNRRNSSLPLRVQSNFGADMHAPSATNAVIRHNSPVTFSNPEKTPDSHPRAHDGQTVVLEAPKSTSLPSIDLGEVKPIYRPTLFLGIGGLGGKVLRRLRQIMDGHFTCESRLSALRMLYVDTDIDSITEATTCREGHIRHSEVLTLPLRDAWEYRTRPVSRLRSISRRWTHNVPRTRRTEGLRALGRLALLDHADSVLDSIRSSIATATHPDSLCATSEESGVPFQPVDPRVYLIASLGGGTGSGTLIDLAYAVRQVLEENGYLDSEVCGLLLCSTHGSAHERDLSPANAFTCLEELQYFNAPGRFYPGEPTIGLAGFSADTPPLSHTYLLGPATAPDNADLSHSIDHAASRLFLSTLTPASTFFDACRMEDNSSSEETTLRLRSSGAVNLGVEPWSVSPESIDALCVSVTRRWQGKSPTKQEKPGNLTDDGDTSDNPQMLACNTPCLPDEVTEALHNGLTSLHEQFAQDLQTTYVDKLGGNALAYLQRQMKRLLSDKFVLYPNLGPELIRQLHQAVGIGEETLVGIGREAGTLAGLSDQVIRASSDILEAILQEWLQAWIDTPSLRLPGARQASAEISSFVRTRQLGVHRCFEQVKRDRCDCEQLLLEVSRGTKTARSDLPALFDAYIRLLASEFDCRCHEKALSEFERKVAGLLTELDNLSRAADQLQGVFAAPGANTGLPPTTNAVVGDCPMLTASLRDEFSQHWEDLAEELERRVETELFDGKMHLSQILSLGSDRQLEFVDAIRSRARTILFRYLNGRALLHLQSDLHQHSSPRVTIALNESLESARPSFTKLAGGIRRLVLLAPEHSEIAAIHSAIEDASGDFVSVVTGETCNLRLCCEIEGLSIDAIKNGLLHNRPDCEEIAPRLHTRIDIDW